MLLCELRRYGGWNGLSDNLFKALRALLMHARDINALFSLIVTIKIDILVHSGGAAIGI